MNIDSIPDEIMVDILVYLNFKELLSISTVCKDFKSFSHNKLLWREHCWNLKGRVSYSHLKEPVAWKNLFKTQYLHDIEQNKPPVTKNVKSVNVGDIIVLKDHPCKVIAKMETLGGKH